MIIRFLIVLFLFSSCTKDQAKPIVSLAEEDPIDCSTISNSFSDDVLPIILNSCATTNCHSSIENAGGFTLESYTQILNSDVLILKTMKNEIGVIAMPYYSPKLNDSLVNIVECWINSGSLDD